MLHVCCLANQERPSWQEVRAMPVQLPAHLQESVTAHCVPSQHVQAHHQPDPRPAKPSCDHPPRHVQGHMCTLQHDIPCQYTCTQITLYSEVCCECLLANIVRISEHFKLQ